jgi:thiosulfate/3-mercaptopyruvate sulfurtransferase
MLALMAAADDPARAERPLVDGMLARRWVIAAGDARALIEAGALVLDARDDALEAARPVPGAVPVRWQRFAEPELPDKGRLLADDAELTRRLQEVGVRGAVPVIVLGDSLAGSGEDGRVVWTLRALGHDAAVAVDGGLPALVAAGLPAIQAPAAAGGFVVRRRSGLAVTREELKAALGRPDLVVLDTREVREYRGETPYGESRGGHVPGARHLFYRDLQAEDGRLLPRAALKARLAALGIGEDSEIVAYCTGGVRSGWVTTVLNDLGLRARNFAGSMWDWSAGDPGEYPLVAEP